jgi:hypothetical protein
MAAYFTSQAYDAPAAFIWRVLTDFPTWPQWFPQVTDVRVEDGASPARGATLIALGDERDLWTRWEISEWREPSLLICEHIESNSPAAPHVQAAYLQFELFDEPEGCTLEVEIGAEGHGVIGDFFVGMTLGNEVRRLLPRIVDAFSDHVVRTAAEP